MFRKLFLKKLDKYASKWIVLVIDVFLMCFSFIVAYAIRFNISFNFDTTSLIQQLPFIAFVYSLYCIVDIISFYNKVFNSRR